MQKTDKYKLNLIDPADDFSPEPLNENARLMESALSGAESKLEAADTKLRTDFTAADAALRKDLGSIGTNLRFETGSYTGTGDTGSLRPNRLTFTLDPQIVLVANAQGMYSPPMVLLKPAKTTVYLAGTGMNGAVQVTWEDHAVSWYSNNSDPQFQGNYAGWTYCYAALGK